MNKIKIGTIYGKNIYTGNPSMLGEGEYYIDVVDNKPAGLFIKRNGNLVSLCSCDQTEKEFNLQEVSILSNYHGKKETVTPAEGYNGIASVTYRKPKLEEKDSVVITKNGVTEIKIGKGYDGLDDVTVIVNVENNE